MNIHINKVNSNFTREPLVRPFGFKGGYMRECWQTVSLLESRSGCCRVGLSTQNVLWSDASVFAAHSESGGNALMYAMLEFALNLVRGQEFDSPITLMDEIWPEVYKYGVKITGNKRLRETFALNALVGLDNAAWLLYAQENNITGFDALLPEKYKTVFSHKHNTIASIPLMAFNIPVDEIVQAVNDGYFFIKIKIGSPGSLREMLEWDKKRITGIHRAIGHIKTPYTENGKLPYYFDANGRYPDKAALLELLEHLDKISALNQVALIEEPFPESVEMMVDDIPVRLAADESAHTDKDALKRIQMGYQAIALKPIAKTLSMSLKIANTAYKYNIPCFCADLTVNPVLVEWNKNVAARLAPFPGLRIGVLETNGHQNYKNWVDMKARHPNPDALWANTQNGVFNLDTDFYNTSGGIFNTPEYYNQLVMNN